MRKIHQGIISLIILLSISSLSFSQILQPVTWEFDAKNISDNEVELIFTATIDDHWHLYAQWLPEGNYSLPTDFVFDSIVGVELIDTVMALSEVHEAYEEMAGAVSRWFEIQAVFVQKVRIDSDVAYVGGLIDYMACDDESCIKLDQDFEFYLNGDKDATILPTATLNGESVEVVESSSSSNSEGKSGLIGFFIIAFGAGLLALLTPCVFPMIPMTVSFFMKDNSDGVSKKGLLNASIFGFSIIIIYVIVGSLVAVFVGPGAANWLSTHWLPNILFFIIFIIFAASFLGMFEITLPSWLITKSDQGADKGGVAGSFFMALTLVLVSFSCTGPIVGSILVESAGGKLLEPIIGMLGFSLAFALPFTLFAIFPSLLSNLPKSGGWLNSVKVVLGFIEIALGFKFLSVADQTYHWGILDREVYLAIWIVTFALLGFYLLGKLKLAHDSDNKTVSVPRLGMAIITFTFVVYLIPGMFGAPLKALAGYLPPQSTHDFDLNTIIRENARLVISNGTVSNTNNNKSICEKPKYGDMLHLPHGLEGFFDYEQGMRCAKDQNKPVFIDFTGHGCVNCREMEARVWSDPRIIQRLRDDYIIIALYVDDKKKMPESEWITSTYDGKVKKTIGKKWADFQITKYNNNAQPYYCLLDTEGELLINPKAYDLNVSNFVDFLDQGVVEFNKINSTIDR